MSRLRIILGQGVLIFTAIVLSACGKEGKPMKISGGQEYIYAPHAGETAQTMPFTVVQGEGEKEEPVAGVKWEILSSGEGVSVNEEGVVTITDAYVAGDINGTDIVLQAAVEGSGESQPLTATLHVREAQRITAFEISLPDSIQRGERVDISLVNCVDQYGEPMEAPDESEIRWEYSTEWISVTDGQLWSRIQDKEPVFAAVCATVGGITVEKRFIAHNIDDYVPDNAILEELARAQIKILKDVDFTQEKEVDLQLYAYINREAAGLTELSVDVTGLAFYAPERIYQVTVRQADGTVTKEDMKAEADGKLRLKLDGAEAVEVSPVLLFSLGKCKLSEEDGYIHLESSDKYTGQELCGFYGSVISSAGGVSLCDESGMFVAELPDGFYNIRITKPVAGTGRSTVRINGASQGTNVGNPGTGGRKGTVPYTYLMEDVCVEGGTMRLSLSEKDFTLAAVEIRRTPDITERRVHIYLGGDSTVSNYYPIEEAEPEPGRFQTGWGQVFAQYVTEENAVTNIAGGGTYAKSWYEMAFPGVVQNGQPGDYFILQAGINDRTYSSIEEMVQYLTYMIEECQEKGITVILATAMQSCKFWKDANGNQLGEFGTPEGSGLAPFMDAIRKLAKEKNVFLVDTGALTGQWYSVVGRSYVAQNYHIYNPQTDVEEDTLHLSYHGALKVAELIATSLAEQRAAGAVDGQGNTLDGLHFHELTTYEIVHKDSAGQEVTESVTGVGAVYKKYAQ